MPRHTPPGRVQAIARAGNALNHEGPLRDDDGGTYRLAADDLALLLRDHPSLQLVVLNACETGALEPEKAINLVQGFTWYGASAVVGTEITIFTGLAYEFGVSFLDAFVAKRLGLGKSVQTARQDLFSRWNPLGLAYVAYGLSDLRLA